MERTARRALGAWRRVWPGAGPFVRREDRIDAAARLTALVCALLAVPLAALLGSSAHARQLELSAGQLAASRPATATVLADAPRRRISPVASGSQWVDVPVRWQVAGAEKRGVLRVLEGTTAGSRRQIWLDRDGNLTAVPVTASDAARVGVGVGLAGWLAAVLTLACGYGLVRAGTDRRRLAAWGREWERVSGEWSTA
ncbi:Rv1733c family protein [Prauserella muralis]|uniref:Uncharacterized protein n=1 Tax=Prauserella muralis TaxID=588067 RepID=A0A2V4AP06_9PSEU|nr:hypothetical protein [Prauserella muralis]PXY22317.1 hypothetical protein BAY60_20810 [Prauserella muralis]TWE27966.1 hypothetical protein FHX69_0615 [Prauserella muralis]